MSEKNQHLSFRDWFVFIVLICSAAISFVAVGTRANDDGLLRVYFLDVGQGDAIFIQAGENQVLIDGGPDAKVIQELAEVMPLGDRSIDALVLTHPDADHINGLIEAFERYDIDYVLENFLERHQSAAYAKWNELKKETKVIEVMAGQRLNIGEGIYLEILYPFDERTRQSKTNNNSIVAKLVYGENELLLTGDIETKVERELLSIGANLDSDFLKVPHHGSKTSTTAEFLDAVAPEAAFIQVGAGNRYGHPHSTVLQRLKERGIKVYRTDTDGRIELILDGLSYKVN